MSSSDFEVQTAPQHGTLSNGAEGHIWYYQSASSYVGLDTVVLSTTEGGLVTYAVNVLNKASNNFLVQDDEYFLETDGSLDFNVFDNDYRDDRTVICLLYTSPSPRDATLSRMPSSA